MRYVILRDDDTNALTPVECLERLYRPFLDRNLPVNLAVIPDVATDAATPGGMPEGFLTAGLGTSNIEPRTSNAEGTHSMAEVRGAASDVLEEATIPIGSNVELVKYLRENPRFRIVQHGCHHHPFEFDRADRPELAARLDRGKRLLVEAGFPSPVTFVAPHDKLSPAAFREVARRFRVISSGWFERRRLPAAWWPKYVLKKMSGAPHWRVGRTMLLSHPGCLLSCNRPYGSMLDEIIRSIHSRRLTVLVTHWWEYFRDGAADEPFIEVLHQTADYLAGARDVTVIAFSDLAQGRVPLN